MGAEKGSGIVWAASKAASGPDRVHECRGDRPRTTLRGDAGFDGAGQRTGMRPEFARARVAEDKGRQGWSRCPAHTKSRLLVMRCSRPRARSRRSGPLSPIFCIPSPTDVASPMAEAPVAATLDSKPARPRKPRKPKGSNRLASLPLELLLTVSRLERIAAPLAGDCLLTL